MGWRQYLAGAALLGLLAVSGCRSVHSSRSGVESIDAVLATPHQQQKSPQGEIIPAGATSAASAGWPSGGSECRH